MDRGATFRPYLMIPVVRNRRQSAGRHRTTVDPAVLSSPTLFPVYLGLLLVAAIVSVLCFNWFGFSLSIALSDL